MRREDDIGQLQQRMIGGRRFLHEHVESGPGQMARSQRLYQRLLVDDAATGAVDDASTLGQHRQLRSADQVACFVGQRRMHGEEIDARQHLGEIGDSLDAHLRSAGRGEKGIEADDLHVQAGGAAGDLTADASETDDAERPAGQLGADELAALPLALFHAGVAGGRMAGQRHQQRDRVLGGADGVAAGRVHDDDALARRGSHVDVVHSHAGADDDAQPARVLQLGRRDARVAADDDAVGAADGFLQGRAFQAMPLVEFDAGLPQQVQARRLAICR